MAMSTVSFGESRKQSMMWTSMAWSSAVCAAPGRDSVFFFFFQAEDGIRDYKVTGVQTCALPIFELRIVEEELDPGRVAGVRELTQRVAPERRPVDDVVRRLRRLEHRKAVVMARRDRDVPDPGALGERHPGRGVELGRVESRREPFVVRHADLAVVHHPLARAELAVHAPVDEQAELRVAEPAAGGEPPAREGNARPRRPGGTAPGGQRSGG